VGSFGGAPWLSPMWRTFLTVSMVDGVRQLRALGRRRIGFW
jgi:hypothetical protein